MKEKKPTIIKDPLKTWWPGDERVEKYMAPVDEAIKRHHKWPSFEFTDIYNRAYEAVYLAITDREPRSKIEVFVFGRWWKVSEKIYLWFRKRLHRWPEKIKVKTDVD